MITYFTAAKAEKLFAEYKRLTLAYWKAQPEDSRGWMARGLPALENEESSALRAQVIHLYPEANTYAKRLGLVVTASLERYCNPVRG